MTTTTQQLSDLGVSIWLDDLSRERIVSGSLKKLIDDRNVVGVTTNPTIFATALAKGSAYDGLISDLAKEGASTNDAVFTITTGDVGDGARIFHPVWEATKGQDGRVSIEVEPGLARDTAGTIAQTQLLWDTIGEPNVMVKIPATKEGLAAITAGIAKGISINVTLIFSLQRHQEVIDAYLEGLEQALAAGIDLSSIRSVASFFVSRVDTEVDKRLDAIGTDEATALRSKAGIANARLAYEVYEKAFATDRAKALLDAGANKQRPLWASTGVKDPALPDTLYVVELAVDETVNTMPEKTLDATYDHAMIEGDRVRGHYDESREVLAKLEALGISYDDVTLLLEKEGIEKFTVSWNELLDTVSAALEAAK